MFLMFYLFRHPCRETEAWGLIQFTGYIALQRVFDSVFFCQVTLGQI